MSMLKGLQAIMDYKATNIPASLLDVLNRFYANFESDSWSPENLQNLVEHSLNEITHHVPESDISKFLKSVKECKTFLTWHYLSLWFLHENPHCSYTQNNPPVSYLNDLKTSCFDLINNEMFEKLVKTYINI